MILIQVFPHHTLRNSGGASLLALREASVKDSGFLFSHQAAALLWLISKP